MLDAEKIVALLNDAIKADPAAITLLFSVRRACNKTLADHPYIQVGRPWADEGPFSIAFIGIINGMLGSVGSDNLIACVYDDNSNQNIISFKVVSKESVGM